ncbi:MAG: helix-turn-helix domain-containing protein [Eubacteriales bacterium]|nr:helix-turn-helix domain-containing protein [Eubacteriales bacterium]
MLLKISQVAKDLGVSNLTVYRRIYSGELKALHLSASCVRIDEFDLLEYKSAIKQRKPYVRKANT